MWMYICALGSPRLSLRLRGGERPFLPIPIVFFDDVDEVGLDNSQVADSPSNLQGHQLNMAVGFWYLVNRHLTNVEVYCSVHWTSHFNKAPEKQGHVYLVGLYSKNLKDGIGNFKAATESSR